MMKNLLKNKKVLWVLFGLFVAWFLIGFLDGAPESWTQNDSRDVFLKSLALFFFIIASLCLLKFICAFPWKKAFSENVFLGFYLSVFSLVIFLYQPYFSLSWLVSEIVNRIIHPAIYTHPFSSLFAFDTLLLFVLWLAGSLLSFFSALVYLGILKVPSFTWQLPDRVKIGKLQIMFGIFLFLTVFVGLIWIQEDRIYTLFMNSFERAGEVRETLEEQNPSMFEEPQFLDMTNALLTSHMSSTYSLFQLSLFVNSFILFALSIMLILKGLVNINSK